MKTVRLSDADVAALNRAADALYTAVEAWSKNRHSIDREVAGGINGSLETSIKTVIDCYPEVREAYRKSQDHFVWLERSNPVCETLDYWMSQWALTHFATTSPMDNTPNMSNFDSVYQQAKENPDTVKYDDIREFGHSAILTGQFDKFTEVYDILRSRT